MKAIQKPSKKNQNRKSESPPSLSIKAMLVFVFFFMIYSSHAQVFYGTTYEGYSGIAKIFKVNGDGSGYKEAKLNVSTGSNTNYTYSSFDRYRLTPSSNGKLYGTTISGGVSEDGVLFEFDPITNEYTEKMSFYYYGTNVPLGQMLEYNGTLYGTSVGMRSNIYSFNPATNSFQIEVPLPCQSPGMILHGGKFYGMTVYGGVQRAGAIFEFDPTEKKYTVLFQFDRTSTGYFPEGGLTYVNGKLYGATATGGKYNQGTLFGYDLTTNHFEKKIDFKSDINGSKPIGDLTVYNNKLLGITANGGASDQGVLFQFDLTTELLSKVIDFSSELPSGTFKLLNGKLYGVATNAGTNGDGILFSIDPSSKEYVRLFEFNGGEKGSQPFGELTLYNNALYGMTKFGGLAGKGVIFKYDIVSNQLHADISFSYSPLGNKPLCLLEVGAKFYGLTYEGGDNGMGVLFELDTTTFELKKLHDFTCDQCDGYNYYNYSLPEGQLLLVDNKLYGIFIKAGYTKGGELFSYDIDQSNYSALVEFNTAETSLTPVGNIALLNGKIIGATKEGGSENNGVVFEYDIANSAFQIKQNLKYATTGSEVRFTNADNTLYGLGSGGSFGNGILSQYDPTTGTLIPKYEFQNTSDGIRPFGTLYFESPKLYGVTAAGASMYGGGNLFEFDIQTQLYRKIPNLPYAQIRAIGNSKLYGATNGGTIFEFNLDTETFQELISIKLEEYYSGESGVNSLIVHSGDFHTSPATITEVLEFIQGKRKDGKPIAATSSNPQEALYFPNSPDYYGSEIKFVSLGYGGSITLAFDNPRYNKPGIDIYIAETSYGDPSFYDYPEKAEVFVSQNGVDWISLGFTNTNSRSLGNGSNSQEACSGKLDSQFDIQSTGLNWIKFIKVVDATDPMAKRRDKKTCNEFNIFAFNAASDGFDLDAIFEKKIIYPNYASGRSRTPENSSATVDIVASNATAVLYPNPVSNFLFINLGEEQELAIMEDEFHLEIFDTQGKSWTNSRELLDESWIINHDVSKLNSGLYIARVTNGNVRRYYKFMKN